MTTLVNTSNKGPSGKKKGRSKKAHVLAASVEQATQNFLEKGEQIAKESQDLKEELVAAVEDVRKQGRQNQIVQEMSRLCANNGFFSGINAFLLKGVILGFFFPALSALAIVNICLNWVCRPMEVPFVVAVSIAQLQTLHICCYFTVFKLFFS